MGKELKNYVIYVCTVVTYIRTEIELIIGVITPDQPSNRLSVVGWSGVISSSLPLLSAINSLYTHIICINCVPQIMWKSCNICYMYV